MKIKINFFQKIFIFSIFIVIFTVLTGYMLNIFFLDDFYVYRKKEKMLEAVDISKSLLSDEEIFKEYVEDLRDKEGIDIAVLKKIVCIKCEEEERICIIMIPLLLVSILQVFQEQI
ncbi:Uncharacterised protein [Fusobacterium varium]|nr:hypothetical protein [Fusobacterium varium]VEH38059.1 Uncharacterised protein [Fusobacterium varium]